jgi:hypothetical protein
MEEEEEVKNDRCLKKKPASSALSPALERREAPLPNLALCFLSQTTDTTI